MNDARISILKTIAVAAVQPQISPLAGFRQRKCLILTTEMEQGKQVKGSVYIVRTQLLNTHGGHKQSNIREARGQISQIIINQLPRLGLGPLKGFFEQTHRRSSRALDLASYVASGTTEKQLHRLVGKIGAAVPGYR